MSNFCSLLSIFLLYSTLRLRAISSNELTRCLAVLIWPLTGSWHKSDIGCKNKFIGLHFRWLRDTREYGWSFNGMRWCASFEYVRGYKIVLYGDSVCLQCFISRTSWKDFPCSKNFNLAKDRNHLGVVIFPVAFCKMILQTGFHAWHCGQNILK